MAFNYDQDFANLDFRAHPELYQIGRGEQGVLSVEPYKSEILPHWRFKTPAIARESAAAIHALFEQYRDAGDFVGMDMARKFLQMGYTRSRRYANHKGGRKYDPATRCRARRPGRSGQGGIGRRVSGHLESGQGRPRISAPDGRASRTLRPARIPQACPINQGRHPATEQVQTKRHRPGPSRKLGGFGTNSQIRRQLERGPARQHARHQSATWGRRRLACQERDGEQTGVADQIADDRLGLQAVMIGGSLAETAMDPCQAATTERVEPGGAWNQAASGLVADRHGERPGEAGQGGIEQVGSSPGHGSSSGL